MSPPKSELATLKPGDKFIVELEVSNIYTYYLQTRNGNCFMFVSNPSYPHWDEFELLGIERKPERLKVGDFVRHNDKAQALTSAWKIVGEFDNYWIFEAINGKPFISSYTKDHYVRAKNVD